MQMPVYIDHYARMKFPMKSTVFFGTVSGVITGWSTNGDMGKDTTYSYQLDNGGSLIPLEDLV